MVARVHERELYELGPRLLASGLWLDGMQYDDVRHVVRGMWDKAGFIGRNVGGYPVASIIAPRPVADGIGSLIEIATGRACKARPVASGYWVGASGARCGPWLRYLYADASTVSPTKLAQARALIHELIGGRP